MINKIKEGLHQDKNIKIVKLVLWILVVLIFLLVIVLTANAFINTKYKDVYLPGTSLGGVDISNLSLEQAKTKVQTRIDELNRQGLVYRLNDKKVTILPSVSSTESADISYPIIIWQAENSLQAIKNWQADNGLGNLVNKVYVWAKGKNWPLSYTWDREQHIQILRDSLNDILSDKQEASFSFKENNLEIIPEKVGQTFDYQSALDDTLERIKYLDNKEIKLKIVADEPQITAAIIKQYQSQILALPNRGDLHLTWEDKDWLVPASTWKTWLNLVADNKIKLTFNQESLQKYLSDNGIYETVEIPVQDAKFKLSSGKVSEFMSSQQGRAIKQAELMDGINKVLNDNKSELKVALVTEVIEPRVMNGDVNDLGIKKVIGTGESDFTGSPVNRIHNIKTGANALNGLLIRPDEEFSLITALGEIDGDHGYKEELVIKGNKTTPEFGGGLCQIGTTVFRAALGTGLPITERRNHSYRVVYYEPAGMDATIYSPKPDLKFINDTGHYILIQSRIEGMKIYFDFWGTPDGRIASTTKPVVYNQVAPPPKKVTKTTALAVGQTKCTERAHSGADAKFDYFVQKTGEAAATKVTFTSHYVPWQEVCLVGATQEEIDAEANGGVPGLPGSTTTPATSTATSTN